MGRVWEISRQEVGPCNYGSQAILSLACKSFQSVPGGGRGPAFNQGVPPEAALKTAAAVPELVTNLRNSKETPVGGMAWPLQPTAYRVGSTLLPSSGSSWYYYYCLEPVAC